MHRDLTDILSSNDQHVSEEQLMDYLNGKLTDAERHELEKMMAADAMQDDALEGLELVENKKQLARHHADINMGLHEKLKEKKQTRKRRNLPQQQLFIIITAAVIALALLVWFIVHFAHTIK
jgi:anti-sigma factor RsiW